MKGGPSHLDTFDPKPKLQQDDGKPLPFDKPRVQFAQTGNLLGSPWKFRPYGKSGIEVSELNSIFVNQGPGKFSGIRTSIAVAKALSFTNKLNLYGFNSNDLKGINYDSIIHLYEKKLITKNLINPVYSS